MILLNLPTIAVKLIVTHQRLKLINDLPLVTREVQVHHYHSLVFWLHDEPGQVETGLLGETI
jgi:hypothetical protein